LPQLDHQGIYISLIEADVGLEQYGLRRVAIVELSQEFIGLIFKPEAVA
jgi:hypothetical protein